MVPALESIGCHRIRIKHTLMPYEECGAGVSPGSCIATRKSGGRGGVYRTDHDGVGLRAPRRHRSRPSVRPMVQSDLVGPRERPRSPRTTLPVLPSLPAWRPPPRSSTPCSGRGTEVLIPADAYYTTRVFAERYLAPYGIRVEAIPTLLFWQTRIWRVQARVDRDSLKSPSRSGRHRRPGEQSVRRPGRSWLPTTRP